MASIAWSNQTSREGSGRHVIWTVSMGAFESHRQWNVHVSSRLWTRARFEIQYSSASCAARARARARRFLRRRRTLAFARPPWCGLTRISLPVCRDCAWAAAWVCACAVCVWVGRVVSSFVCCVVKLYVTAPSQVNAAFSVPPGGCRWVATTTVRDSSIRRAEGAA